MFGLSPAHLIIVLVILLIIVGPGKLPETGAAIGRAIRGFKDAMEGTESPSGVIPAQPPAPPAQPMAVQSAPVAPVPPQPADTSSQPPVPPAGAPPSA